MREIAFIIICSISAALDFKCAYDQKKIGDKSGTILMCSLGILSVVCIIINAIALIIQ